MNLGSLQARWIEFQSKDYYQTLSLRNSVLRKPIGLQFSKDQLSYEIDDFHLGIFSVLQKFHFLHFGFFFVLIQLKF